MTAMVRHRNPCSIWRSLAVSESRLTDLDVDSIDREGRLVVI